MSTFSKTMKSLSLILLILMILSIDKMSAQIATKWYFGLDMGYDFSTNSVFSTTNPTMMYDNTSSAPTLQGYNVESSSVVYDNTGNLVFIAIPTAKGSYGVLDKNFANKGSIATTSDAAQGSLAFPVPGSTNTWYLCSVDAMTSTCGTGDNGTNRGANYYLITNTGSTVTVGAVQNVVASDVAECQVGVVNSTATGYWWIIHVLGSDEFRVYSVTNSGISYHHSDHVGNAFAACDYVAMMAVNNCNNKLALAVGGNVSLFDFNNATGAISNPQTWAVSCSYGLEFSTDNRYLFVSTGTSGLCSNNHVYQYDITSGAAATISGTQSDLGTTYSGSTGKSGHLQLGPDGNIYVAQMSANGASSYPHYLGRITNINTKPATFTYNYQTINDGANNKMAMTMGLPTILKASITGQAVVQIPNASSICVNNSNVFSYNFSGVAVSQTWTLTPSTGFTYTSGSSTSASPTIKFTSTGTYTVQLSVTDNCGYTYTDATSITVKPQITPTGTVSCSPSTGTVSSPNGAYTYVWYSDAAGTNAIASGTSVSLPIAGTGNVYIKATSGSSSSTVALTNGTATGHPWSGSDAGTTHTMGFTVNKGPLTFGSFEWEAPYGSWAASNQNTTFTVQLKNSGGSVLYSNTQTVATNGPTWVSGYPFTENVNQVLPIGSYSIVITATSGIGGPIKTTSPCTANQADAQSALTYATSGVCGFAAAFSYSLTTYSTTTLACSNLSAAIPYNCPLPVTWISFDAARSNSKSVLLTWSTAIEESTKAFYIQRSLDGITFENIGMKDAAGYSASIKNYSYPDMDAPSGSVYYRLLQMDIDGKYSYSKIVYVGDMQTLGLSLIPNPGNGSFAIYGLSGDVLLDVTVYTVTGQPVFHGKTYSGEVIDLEDKAKGFYLVKVIAGNSEQTIRYINQ